nr:alpha/beta hydrolase [uncultured Campylobacter sp.]
MKDIVVYIHGKNGSAAEAARYRRLFAGSDVLGSDYEARTPWEAKEEFAPYFESILKSRKSVTIVANSIGAFFAMHALRDMRIKRAYFISPIVNMENLILNMMSQANASEEELRDKGELSTKFGEKLSWRYLCYAREHPIFWTVPTHILYGENDDLTSFETICEFANQIGATLTVMKNGEHRFSTAEQMQFLDDWIRRYS